MKKFFGCLSILLLIGCAIVFAPNFLNQNKNLYKIKAPNGVFINLNLPEGNWDTGYLQGTDMQYTAKCVPANDNQNNSDSKSVTITFYDGTGNYYPDAYYNQFISEKKKEADRIQSVVESEIQSTSSNNVYFIWRIKSKDKSEYCRFFRTQKGMYAVRFSHAKSDFSDDERKEVLKTLKSIKESEQ